MAKANKLSQTIKVRVICTDDVAQKIVDDFKDEKNYLAEEWEVSDVENEHIIDIIIYGNCKVYASHSYYEPTEYDYDEQFLFEGDEDIVKECFLPKGIEVVDIKIGEID